MALAPFMTLEEYLELNPPDNHSHVVYVGRAAIVGPRGPAGPPGAPGGPTGSKNVKSFGAVGDGVVNDTAAINEAIAAAVVSNYIRMVFFPPGIYRVTDDLIQPGGVEFQGSGRMTSYLSAGANDIALIRHTATALTNDFRIRGLGFLQNSYTGVVGISLDGVDSAKRLSVVQLEDLYFNTRTGIYLKFCANVHLQNCFANACTEGFWLNNVADATLVSAHAQNGTGYGFLVQGGEGAFDEGIKLLGCTTNGQAYGLFVTGQDWGQAVGCSFTTCTGGPLAFASARNWRVTSTDLAAAAAVSGVVIDSLCSDIQISENFIALNSFGVANLGGTRIAVRGNNFEANTNIDIYTTGTKGAITDNICNSTGNAASILEVTPANYNMIVGNVVNGTITKVGANSVDSPNIIY